MFKIDGAALRAAFDRFAQALAPAVEAMRQVGIAANNPFIRSAVARYAEYEEDALRLSINTPLLLEQARSLIREHGLGFAERVGELVAQGWDCDWAAETLAGQHGRWWSMRARLRLNAATLPGGAEAYFPILKHQPPHHGSPSSFVEVCGDENVGRLQTACDRCAFYSPPPSCMSNSTPALTCALHPLGRPEGRCGDWEDRRTEAAAIARVEAAERAEQAGREARERRLEQEQSRDILQARTFINGVEQVVCQESRPSDRVLPERPWVYPGVPFEEFQYFRDSNGCVHRIAEEPVQLPPGDPIREAQQRVEEVEERLRSRPWFRNWPL